MFPPNGAFKDLDYDLQQDVIVFLRPKHVRDCYRIGLKIHDFPMGSQGDQLHHPLLGTMLTY
jgi:hypothetical protein